MHTFMVLLHVVAAVFLIGPLVVAPMFGLRALRIGNPEGLRDSARQTTLYGLLSLIVFAFGTLAVATEKKDYTFGTIWVNVSMTLYILALVVVLLVLAPALNKASKLVSAPSTVQIDPVTGELPAPEPGPVAPVPLSAQEPEVKGKLDALRGRIAASSGIVSVLLLVTTALMVLKPFGD
jgi:uncharacterized membrane protein